MNILVVIPAKGNSKGIPHKNLLLMNGKPLIFYALRTVKDCHYAMDMVVSTDDENIRNLVSSYGISVTMRDISLSEDGVSLDAVVFDAVKKLDKDYEVIITVQPTSPTLKSLTLTKAIDEFISKKCDTLISVTNNPHLAWTKKNGKIIPLYKQRLNRQELPFYLAETGAFLITKREFVSQHSRIGKNVCVYEVPKEESMDIDDKNDWVAAEAIICKKSIVFRVDGCKEIGMGHINHCLTLAYRLLPRHDILFVMKKNCLEGIGKIKNVNIPIEYIDTDSDFFNFLEGHKVDIVINDCLDTSVSYMKRLKSLVDKVVTIEDRGRGAKVADIVINAIYDPCKANSKNVFSGEKYICLRDEFITTRPKEFSKNVKQVLFMFGGTDPSNITGFAYHIIYDFYKQYPHIEFHFITGIGYDFTKSIVKTDYGRNIIVHKNCECVSSIMKESDIAVSAQGRTIYELAHLGIPSIVLAQNERETSHYFGQMENGFLNLGLKSSVSAKTVSGTIKWLIDSPNIRKEMRSNMLKHDLTKGITHEINLILGDEK